MNTSAIQNLSELYQRNRGSHYTTRLFDQALSEGKMVMVFSSEVVGMQALNSYLRLKDIRENPRIILGEQDITIISAENYHQIRNVIGKRAPVYLDNSAIISILRFSEGVVYDNHKLKEEIDSLKPYRAFTDPHSYFKKEIASLESKNRILGHVADGLISHVRRLQLILDFKMPLIAFLSFYALMFIYLTYAFSHGK